MTDVLPTQQLASLLTGAPWRRLAVLGDSIAAGVREPHPGYRDLSWVDRLAEPLGLAAPGLAVLNLGERNLVARAVRERQLALALAFQPDLAIVAAGGNDALRPGFSRAAVERELAAIVRPLRAVGADVVMIELLDIAAAGLVPPAADAPLRELAAATRAVAADTGAVLVAMRAHPAAADPGIYAADRVHLNARGHAIVGGETVRALAAAIPATTRPAPLAVALTMDEILEDLSHPGPPPGRWNVPARDPLAA